MVDGFIDGCETQKKPRQTNYSPYRKKISASFQVLFQYLLLTLLWYKKTLQEFVEGAESCVCYSDREAIKATLTGEYTKEQIFTDHWEYPAGAFHGADGGSC